MNDTTQDLMKTEEKASVLPAQSEWNTILSMAATLVKSGMLPNSIRTPEAAAAIILKGRELQIPPMQSFSHIHVIQGKPSCSSELMLALLARGRDGVPGSGVTFKWINDGSDRDEAIIRFSRKGFDDCDGRFSMEDARTAGLIKRDSGWEKYPANLLRARAVSNGARMIAPDLLAGMSYTPEELGADVDQEGNVIEVQAEVVQDAEPRAPQYSDAPNDYVPDDAPPPPSDEPEPTSRRKPDSAQIVERCLSFIEKANSQQEMDKLGPWLNKMQPKCTVKDWMAVDKAHSKKIMAGFPEAETLDDSNVAYLQHSQIIEAIVKTQRWNALMDKRIEISEDMSLTEDQITDLLAYIDENAPADAC